MWIGRYRLPDGRQPWIASEYVTGPTLQATVEEGEPDPGGFDDSIWMQP
jgi:hypothetical protein